MGLDAYVACACVEMRLAKPPPSQIAALVKVDPNTGTVYLDSPDKRLRQVYSRWCASKPCAHENFVAISRRLGNISAIDHVRSLVASQARDPASEFPVLWKRVLKSGFHSGDALPFKSVQNLHGELLRLRAPSSAGPFFERLEELVLAALESRKPLGF